MSTAPFVNGLPSLRKLHWLRSKIMANYAALSKETPITLDEIAYVTPKPLQVSATTGTEPNFTSLEGCIVAAYIADILCYPKPSNQVDILRLSEIMYEFPSGFIIAYVYARDKENHLFTLPIGYTAWFPIDKDTYAEMSEGKLSDRKLPRPCLDPERIGGVHIFNASVISSCQHKNRQPNDVKIAKPLLLTLANDIKKFCDNNANIEGLTTITVSKDGARLAAEKFQMLETGTAEDDTEVKIWVSPL